MDVINLPYGDNRVANFVVDLIDFIRERGDGLPYPSVLGAIDIAKAEIMRKQEEQVY